VTDRQQQLLAQFEVASCPHDDAAFAWLTFVRRLLRERDLEGCYFAQSHVALFIFKGPPGEAANWRRLTVRASARDVWLDVMITHSVEPVRRWVKEHVICSPEVAFSEFDRMFATFSNANAPPGGEG
jgi:hypothetical protein